MALLFAVDASGFVFFSLDLNCNGFFVDQYCVGDLVFSKISYEYLEVIIEKQRASLVFGNAALVFGKVEF